MSGSRTKEREYGQVTFRVRSREHVEVVAEIITIPMGIPTGVAVWLMIDATAFTVTDAFLQTITNASFPFTRSGINRGSVTGNGKLFKVNETFHVGFIQKKGFEDIKEPPCRSEILWWFEFKFSQQIIDGDLINGSGFLTFFLRFIRFFFWWMNRVCEIILIRKPEAACKVIEGSDTGGIPNSKSGEDCIEIVMLKGRSP